VSRIVLSTIGSFGDLHPKIAIAIELQKRGHDVVFATHKEYLGKIEALGFECHRMRPDNTALGDPHEMARMMDLKRVRSMSSAIGFARIYVKPTRI
jgi:UDP:flavonoid glycosyltransferase YjiC (YdhE family)